MVLVLFAAAALQREPRGRSVSLQRDLNLLAGEIIQSKRECQLEAAGPIIQHGPLCVNTVEL